jgi:hypothetical protein
MIYGNPDGLYELAQLLLEQRRAEATHQRIIAQLPRSSLLGALFAASRGVLAPWLAVFRPRPNKRSCRPSVIRGAA